MTRADFRDLRAEALEAGQPNLIAGLLIFMFGVLGTIAFAALLFAVPGFWGE